MILAQNSALFPYAGLNRLVLLMVLACVLCEVRTKFLYVM